MCSIINNYANTHFFKLKMFSADFVNTKTTSSTPNLKISKNIKSKRTKKKKYKRLYNKGGK